MRQLGPLATGRPPSLLYSTYVCPAPASSFRSYGRTHTQYAVAISILCLLPAFTMAPVPFIHTAHSLSATFTHALPGTPAALTSQPPAAHSVAPTFCPVQSFARKPVLHFPPRMPVPSALSTLTRPLSCRPLRQNRSHFPHSPCTIRRDRAPPATRLLTTPPLSTRSCPTSPHPAQPACHKQLSRAWVHPIMTTVAS